MKGVYPVLHVYSLLKHKHARIVEQQQLEPEHIKITTKAKRKVEDIYNCQCQHNNLL